MRPRARSRLVREGGRCGARLTHAEAGQAVIVTEIATSKKCEFAGPLRVRVLANDEQKDG